MKHMKKLLSLLLVLCLVLSLSCTAFAAGAEKPLDGKTVILHSNDVHGAIDLYAAMAALKADYEAQGAEVILADAGDYSQGTVYVSVNKGADAVTMMNATGYDVVTLGNHEFDYGYAQLVENMKAAKFQVLCADVLGADGKTIFDANTIIEKGGVKIGFFGLETPEAQTKANPKLIQGLKFLAGADGKELYDCAAAQVADLKAKGADLVVCLAHLGVDESSEPYTSYDLAKNVQGIDFIIDGHSHTVMTEGPNGEPIQSTGTAFANIGVITIDNATSGWYKPAVDFAQASGLMSGMGDNKFAPDVTTTRAMVAQVMYELADEPDVSGLTCPLSDVDSTAWYADAVIWAYNAGVVSGYEDGTFRPGRAITRQEMAVMFYGMLFGTDSILAEDDIKLALGAFKDGDTVASWAREAVAVCYISGIMVGDNGSFKPTDLLSRAQLAQVFRSFYETQLTFALDELPAAPDQPSTPEQPSMPTAA